MEKIILKEVWERGSDGTLFVTIPRKSGITSKEYVMITPVRFDPLSKKLKEEEIINRSGNWRTKCKNCGSPRVEEDQKYIICKLCGTAERKN